MTETSSSNKDLHFERTSADILAIGMRQAKLARMACSDGDGTPIHYCQEAAAFSGSVSFDRSYN